MLKRCGTKFYTSENEDLKSSVVERFHRRCIAISPIDVLDDMLHSYTAA